MLEYIELVWLIFFGRLRWLRRALDRVKVLLMFLQHKWHVVIPFLLLLLQRIVKRVLLNFSFFHQFAACQSRPTTNRLEDFLALENPLVIVLRYLFLLISHLCCHLRFLDLLLKILDLGQHHVECLSILYCLFGLEHGLQHFNDHRLLVLVGLFALLDVLELFLLFKYQLLESALLQHLLEHS